MAHQDVLPLYINGRTVAATSGDTFTVTNPYDGSLLATVGQASRGDLDEAVRTMAATGRDMMTKYKETSMGGLAVQLGLPVNITEC